MATSVDILQEMIRARNQRSSDTDNAITNAANSIGNIGKVLQQRRENQLQEILLTSKVQQAQTEAQNSALQSQLLNTFLKGGDPTKGGNQFPPGTSLKAGPLTIPLNSKLTESEQASVAGSRALSPIVSDIEKLLDKGVYDSKLGNFGRTIEQLAVDSQSALATSLSPQLQQLQGRLNALKKTLPFTEGGKQLSKTEKGIVFALLNTAGKSNDQIKTDLKEALAIIKEKEKIALGGANAVKDSGVDLPKGITEEDIQYTMEKHGLTREQVLEKLSA